jgi:hypothetical protein
MIVKPDSENIIPFLFQSFSANNKGIIDHSQVSNGQNSCSEDLSHLISENDFDVDKLIDPPLVNLNVPSNKADCRISSSSYISNYFSPELISAGDIYQHSSLGFFNYFRFFVIIL